jgi:hypothetical protein
MKSAMELETLLENIILPESFCFYDFGGGNTVIPVPDKGTGTYIITSVVRLVKGDRHKDIEISILRGTPGTKSVVRVFVGDFSNALDNAILELSWDGENMPDGLETEERKIWERLHSLIKKERISPLAQEQIFEICKNFIVFGSKSEGRSCQMKAQ